MVRDGDSGGLLPFPFPVRRALGIAFPHEWPVVQWGADGGSQPTHGGWQPTNGCWRFNSEGRRLTHRRWPPTNGSWWPPEDGWGVSDGIGQLEFDYSIADLPPASGGSDVIRRSWVLLSRTRDAAGSY